MGGEQGGTKYFTIWLNGKSVCHVSANCKEAVGKFASFQGSGLVGLCCFVLNMLKSGPFVMLCVVDAERKSGQYVSIFPSDVNCQFLRNVQRPEKVKGNSWKWAFLCTFQVVEAAVSDFAKCRGGQ